MPIGRAVLSMSVPMIISQAITVIYNIADTFFVGQMNQPDQVAAITVALPLFYFLTALTNLFGVGGSGMVSHHLGLREDMQAKSCAAFCIWTSVGISLLYGVLIFLVRPMLLPAIGADADTYRYAYQYVFWTITIGSVPTVFNPMIANLIRAEGYSRQASFGVAFGGILNIILDPLFIFGFRLEIAGAAIATMLSAWAATLYFLFFMYRKRKNIVISLNPKHYTLKKSVSVRIIVIGLPNFLISFLATISNTILNPLVGAYSNEALAGIGIAKKIDMLAFAIAQGMTQGTLPLVSYSYASGNRDRMVKLIQTTALYGLLFALSGMSLLLIGAAPLSRLFIADAATASYSKYFIRVIALTCPTTTLTLLTISVFQATERKVPPLVISTLRKGSLDIPLMFLLNHLFQLSGLVWAVPLADLGALIVAGIIFVPYIKKLRHTL